MDNLNPEWIKAKRKGNDELLPTGRDIVKIIRTTRTKDTASGTKSHTSNKQTVTKISKLVYEPKTSKAIVKSIHTYKIDKYNKPQDPECNLEQNKEVPFKITNTNYCNGNGSHENKAENIVFDQLKIRYEEFTRKKREREQEFNEIQKVLNENLRPEINEIINVNRLEGESCTDNNNPLILLSVPSENDRKMPENLDTGGKSSPVRSKTQPELIPEKSVNIKKLTTAISNSNIAKRSMSNTNLKESKSADHINSPVKKKSYDPEEARRYIKEQKKRNKSKFDTKQGMSSSNTKYEKEEIKKRLENLRISTLKILDKNVKKSREKTEEPPLGNRKNPSSSNLELRLNLEVKDSKKMSNKCLPKSKLKSSSLNNDCNRNVALKPSNSTENLKVTKIMAKKLIPPPEPTQEPFKKVGLLRRPDNFPISPQSLDMNKENFELELLTPNLHLNLKETSLKDNTAACNRKTEKRNSPNSISTNPSSSSIRKELKLSSPTPEPEKCVAEKSVIHSRKSKASEEKLPSDLIKCPDKNIEEELKLKVPDTKLDLRSTTTFQEKSTQFENQVPEKPPTPYWLKPSSVQLYPYNFIMAVRKKLEAIANPVLIAKTISKAESEIFSELKPKPTLSKNTPSRGRSSKVKRRLVISKNVDDSSTNPDSELEFPKPLMKKSSEKNMLAVSPTPLLDSLKFQIPEKILTEEDINFKIPPPKAISKSLSEIASNFSSITVHVPESNTMSEVSSIQSESIRQSKIRSNFKISKQKREYDDDTTISSTVFSSPEKHTIKPVKDVDHTIVLSENDFTPLSIENITNLKVRSKSKYEYINLTRGDGLQIPSHNRFITNNTRERNDVDQRQNTVDFEHLLEQFNRSLSQVIEVNQQLQTSLSRPSSARGEGGSDERYDSKESKNTQKSITNNKQNQNQKNPTTDYYSTDFEDAETSVKSKNSSSKSSRISINKSVDNKPRKEIKYNIHRHTSSDSDRTESSSSGKSRKTEISAHLSSNKSSTAFLEKQKTSSSDSYTKQGTESIKSVENNFILSELLSSTKPSDKNNTINKLAENSLRLSSITSKESTSIEDSIKIDSLNPKSNNSQSHEPIKNSGSGSTIATQLSDFAVRQPDSSMRVDSSNKFFFPESLDETPSKIVTQHSDDNQSEKFKNSSEDVLKSKSISDNREIVSETNSTNFLFVAEPEQCQDSANLTSSQFSRDSLEMDESPDHKQVRDEIVKNQINDSRGEFVDKKTCFGQESLKLDFQGFNEPIVQVQTEHKTQSVPRTHTILNSSIGSDLFAIFNQSDIEVSVLSRNGSFSEANLSYSSIGIYEQHLAHQANWTEYLSSVLKIREKVLLDSTRNQIALLEFEKEKYKSKGLVLEISAIKKKQRAILMKMEKEREEIKKILKTSEHSTIRKSRNSSIRSKLPDNFSNSLAITRRSLSSSHSSNKSNKIVKGFEIEGNRNLEMMLKKREEELHRRKEQVENLLKWHQRLDKEEQEIKQMEQMLYEYNAERQTISPKIRKKEKKLSEIDKSLKVLHDINSKSVETNSSSDYAETSGMKLNKLWKRLTGRNELKFDQTINYKLNKKDLEKLYENAKKCVLEDFDQVPDMKALLEQSKESRSSNNISSLHSSRTYLNNGHKDVPSLNLDFSSAQSDNEKPISTAESLGPIKETDSNSQSIPQVEEDDVQQATYDSDDIESLKEEHIEVDENKIDDEDQSILSDNNLIETPNLEKKILIETEDNKSLFVDTELSQNSEIYNQTNVTVIRSESKNSNDHGTVTEFSPITSDERSNEKTVYTDSFISSDTFIQKENLFPRESVIIQPNNSKNDISLPQIFSETTLDEEADCSKAKNETYSISQTINEFIDVTNNTSITESLNTSPKSDINEDALDATFIKKSADNSQLESPSNNEIVDEKANSSENYTSIPSSEPVSFSHLDESIKENDTAIDASSKIVSMIEPSQNSVSSTIKDTNPTENRSSSSSSSSSSASTLHDVKSANENSCLENNFPIEIPDDEILLEDISIPHLEITIDNYKSDFEENTNSIQEHFIDEVFVNSLSPRNNSNTTELAKRLIDLDGSLRDLHETFDRALSPDKPASSTCSSPRTVSYDDDCDKENTPRKQYDTNSGNGNSKVTVRDYISCSENNSGKMPDIISEAEIRRRSNVLGEIEVKNLESAAVPLLFLREIPNKPPPPYVPPAHGSPMTTIFPSEERIKEITYRRTKELYEEALYSDQENIIKSPSILDENITNIYERIILDICKECIIDYQPTLDHKNIDINKYKLPLALFNPPDRLKCIQDFVYKKVRKLLRMDRRTPRRTSVFSIGQRKRDHIDDILIQELYEEEDKWTNFDAEDDEARDNVSDEIFDDIIIEFLIEIMETLKIEEEDNNFNIKEEEEEEEKKEENPVTGNVINIDVGEISK